MRIIHPSKLGRRGMHAISPVVATLILIIVAIVGAVAVGLIVSGVGNQSNKQANADRAASEASIVLTVSGVASSYPTMTTLAEQFETLNQGVQIELQSGGSAAGLTSVINGLSDIGITADSGSLQFAQTQFPNSNLQSAELGASAEVVIEHGSYSTPGGYLSDGSTTCKAVTQAALKEIYTLGQFNLQPGACGNLNALDYTGTQLVSGNTFTAFVGQDESSNGGAVESYLGLPSLAGTSELTDAALLAAVENTPNSIALIDLPWNINQGNAILAQVQIDTVTPLTSPTLNLDPGQSEANFNNYILQALKSTSNPQWPDKQALTAGTLLTNHFFAFTKGTPSALAQKFIQFIQNPNAQSAFDSQGLLAVSEYKLAENGSPLILFSADSYTSESALLENSFTTSTGILMAPPIGAGSTLLATNIKGGAPVSVFVSISKKAVGPAALGSFFPGWALAIATDQMVLAYSPISNIGEDQVKTDAAGSNWPAFFTDLTTLSNVKVGIAAPDPDPAGYRGWLVLMLADLAYNSGAGPAGACNTGTPSTCVYSQNGGSATTPGAGGPWVPQYASNLLSGTQRNVTAAHAAALVASLETGNIQFLFLYRSLAISDGLNYVILPDQVNLGSSTFSSTYSKLTYITPNAAPFAGAQIQLFLSVPTDSTNGPAAISFVAYTAQNYQTVLANAGMVLLPKPVLYYNSAASIPTQLNQLVTAGTIVLSTPAPPPNQLT